MKARDDAAPTAARAENGDGASWRSSAPVDTHTHTHSSSPSNTHTQPHTDTDPGAAAGVPRTQKSGALPFGCTWARVRAFLIAQHLPLGLLIFIIFGFSVPEPGVAAGKTPLNTISICGIFFLSGLQLQTQEVKAAMKAYVAITYGLLTILLFTPLTAFAFVKLPLSSPEYAQGLALFAAMPTTISSGVLMTAEAKGNVALALFFSVVTNLVAVLTIPFFAAYILGSGSGSAGLDPLDLLWKLTLTILLPLLVGKALRYFSRVVDFAKKYKLQLKFLSSALLISVPWVNISQSAQKLRKMHASDFFALVAIGIAMHIFYLIFNYVIARVLPMKLSERKAVVINGSQKTVNTAMSVIEFLPEAAADRGLLTLPCILSHFVQIIIDAFVVAYWKKYEDPAERPSAMAAAVAAPGVQLASVTSDQQEDEALAVAVDVSGVQFSPGVQQSAQTEQHQHASSLLGQ